MATHDHPPALLLSAHPHSPPMTPSARNHRLPPQTLQTSPLYKRMAIYKSTLTPPLEYIEPTGEGHHFKFTRPQSVDPSSPTDSGQAYATATSQQSEDEDDSDKESEDESDDDDEEERPMRLVGKADFELEELDSDEGYDCDTEVIRPSHCEDARSDRSATKSEILARLKEIKIEENDSSDEEEREMQERRYREKKKRWSAGIFKRSHSQSVEGDSSYSDNDPLDDVDPAARRLRRRVRGPADRRGSLIFEDRGFSNTNNIAEVEEPDDYHVTHSQGPPSIPSDDAFTLDELPFWNGGESMEIEIESE
ncbi:hypothetical protein ACN47E_003702 [Coniothyrium glycines]